MRGSLRDRSNPPERLFLESDAPFMLPVCSFMDKQCLLYLTNYVHRMGGERERETERVDTYMYDCNNVPCTCTNTCTSTAGSWF